MIWVQWQSSVYNIKPRHENKSLEENRLFIVIWNLSYKIVWLLNRYNNVKENVNQITSRMLWDATIYNFFLRYMYAQSLCISLFYLQAQLVLVGDIKSCVHSLWNVRCVSMNTCKILSDNLYNSELRLKKLMEGWYDTQYLSILMGYRCWF